MHAMFVSLYDLWTWLTKQIHRIWPETLTKSRWTSQEVPPKFSHKRLWERALRVFWMALKKTLNRRCKKTINETPNSRVKVLLTFLFINLTSLGWRFWTLISWSVFRDRKSKEKFNSPLSEILMVEKVCTEHAMLYHHLGSVYLFLRMC